MITRTNKCDWYEGTVSLPKNRFLRFMNIKIKLIIRYDNFYDNFFNPDSFRDLK